VIAPRAAGEAGNVSEPYDSTEDTKQHIHRVASLLLAVADNLRQRAVGHDASKLEEPEKSGFDIIRPRLDHDDIDSDEYRATLREYESVLRHHYDRNRHHPEHFPDGISGMTLWDVVEMVCDWAAASQRKPGGKVNLDWAAKRFGIEPQLARIFANTVEEMDW
jgi:hypothetical protein